MSTVRGWLVKPGSDRKVDGKPLTVPAGSDPTAFSFTNLLELFVLRFYPFTRGFGREDPKLVAIDPFVKFGRPVIRGNGVTTNAVAKFVKAGDSILELADDYRVELVQVEETVRYELAG